MCTWIPLTASIYCLWNFCGLWWGAIKWSKFPLQMFSNTTEKEVKKSKSREQMRWGNHMVINLFPFYAHAIFALIFKNSATIYRPTMSWKIEMLISLHSSFCTYWRINLQEERKSYETVNGLPFWTSHPQDSFGQELQACTSLFD